MSLLERVAIILVEPEGGANIGSSARALKTMGLSRLRLVRPQEDPLAPAALKMAVHAEDVLRSASRHQSLEEAIAGDHWVIGATARPRDNPQRKLPLDPAAFSLRLRALSAGVRVALVFGPERCGLTNDQLGLCQDLLTWPTAPAYPVLNLAQAVLLAAWEVRRVALIETRPGGAPEASPTAGATAGEIQGLIDHLAGTLARIGYLNSQNPRIALDELRAIFSRAELRPREFKMLRGIFHKMDGYAASRGGPTKPERPGRRRQ